MTPSEIREDKKLAKFLKANGGQPVGVLVERNPLTRMFDAVTANGKSVVNGKALPKGTKVRLWGNGEIVVI